MAIKTLISLTKRNDVELHNIVLNFDDATVEAITDAAIELLRRHRLSEGDRLSVSVITTTLD